MPLASGMMSGILMALLACFDMLLMRATTGTGAMFVVAFSTLRGSGVLVALLASFDMLFMRAATGTRAVSSFILFALRGASILVALLASLDMLFMASALICHRSIPFGDMRRPLTGPTHDKPSGTGEVS